MCSTINAIAGSVVKFYLLSLFHYFRSYFHVHIKSRVPSQLVYNFNLFHAYILHTGLFYFVLANIHPRYRSSLKAIQLVAICKNEYLKTYGIFTVVQHFVKDIKKLEQVRGHIQTITGKFNVIVTLSSDPPSP